MDRLAGSAPYDVVLLSYRVPGADGVKLVRFIRALEHRVTAAVVMVTGTNGVVEQARAAGADDVLLKPVNPSALVWAVDEQVK
jgi:CheY-like chemotaxis protein